MRSRARDKPQEHPTQDSPLYHEQDTDISPTMDTDSATAETMVDELRNEALHNLMTYKDSMKCSYDKKLRARAFKPGDWVLRTRQRSNEEPNRGKLGENWEGPFIIERLASKGSYFLKNLTGDDLTKP
ncbi:hypothetical protein IFM89_033429 [Coptis chinensis]|uniref:Uncharacterized protein n=1 Tax=Coptis chinensis TaxID=261450 RepID=A0A835LW63_9MAGN|nr:hypothetical protein IFM89_033429 [Coptis chinensis]